METVRYSALQTPMQTSTGPPGEWGRRASAMSHTILQTQRAESDHAPTTEQDGGLHVHAPLRADVLQRYRVAADSRHLDLSDLFHL